MRKQIFTCPECRWDEGIVFRYKELLHWQCNHCNTAWEIGDVFTPPSGTHIRAPKEGHLSDEEIEEDRFRRPRCSDCGDKDIIGEEPRNPDPEPQHRWSEWPGRSSGLRWCLDCGTYNAREDCLAQGHPINCKNCVNEPCPSPGANLCNPY